MEDKSTAELTFNNNNNKGEWKFPLEIQRFDAEKEKELLAAFPGLLVEYLCSRFYSMIYVMKHDLSHISDIY